MYIGITSPNRANILTASILIPAASKVMSFSLGEEFVRHVDQGLGDITRKDDVETGVACSNTEKNLVTIWKDLEKIRFWSI